VFKSLKSGMMDKSKLDRIINIFREEMSLGAGGGALYRGSGREDSGSPTAGYDKPLKKKRSTPIGRYGSRKRWLDHVRNSKA
jgi:hypothetical protein